MTKRKRRAFTPEFKAETVRLVLDGGKPIPEVARDQPIASLLARRRHRLADFPLCKA